MQTMTPGKYVVILNPVAGKGKAAGTRPAIESFLKKHRQEYEIILTERRGHALEIAQNYPLDAGVIMVAAGGDGTANEVANGLLRRDRQEGAPPPVMAVLPVGRGNDFSCNVKVGDKLGKALEILLRRKSLPLDAGMVTGGFFPKGRYFVNGLGIGFDCKVGFEAAKLKIKSGLSYALGALITLAKYEPSPLLEISYDDNTITVPAVLVSIMNGVRMGGTFLMGPQALVDDGLFDLCVIRRPKTRSRLLKIVMSYPKGRQADFEEAQTGRAKCFHLKALAGVMAAHCDGETVCMEGTELSVECVPAALNLIRS
jgi:YegS/Rv2252/BmrU family lipid kinase